MKRIGRILAHWLYPGPVTCLCCDRPIENDSPDGLLCSLCCKSLEHLFGIQEQRSQGHNPPEGLAFLYAAYPYEAQAKTLVYRLKYDRLRRATIPLARAMFLLPAGEEELIVPVPTTKVRKRQRGFNQSALLADWLAREYGMPCCESALVRTDDAPSQTELTAKQRAENVRNSMEAASLVRGKRILLVDDVYTTGATAREACRALREAGCRSVGMFAACLAGQKDSDQKAPDFLR